MQHQLVLVKELHSCLIILFSLNHSGYLMISIIVPFPLVFCFCNNLPPWFCLSHTPPSLELLNMHFWLSINSPTAAFGTKSLGPLEFQSPLLFPPPSRFSSSLWVEDNTGGGASPRGDRHISFLSQKHMKEGYFCSDFHDGVIRWLHFCCFFFLVALIISVRRLLNIQAEYFFTCCHLNLMAFVLGALFYWIRRW